MIKDIPELIVENVAIAVVPEKIEGADEWNVYLINLKEEKIEGVLVSSKGYGEIEGKEVKTSMLRHFLDEVPAKSYKKIEPILDRLFGLSNEFWLSFYLNNKMYDKKYIFLPESITMENCVKIPYLNKPGVMIK